MRNQPTDSQALVREVESTLRQFMYLPNEHAATVLSLWIPHTHLWSHDGQFLPERTGRVYFGSNKAGAGKTLALELTTLMSHNGEMHTNPTQFGLITSINSGLGTNGIDEIDRFFGPTGGKAADVQTVILAGYRKGAQVTRQVQNELYRQNIHGPAILAGKNLNRFMTAEVFETLRTRSFIIALERKPSSVKLDKYRSEIHENRLRSISHRLSRWGQRNGHEICNIDVEEKMDAIGLDNRDAEIWSILFRIAEFVGGDWPKRIEKAARAMVLGEWDMDDEPILSPAEELLMQCRIAFNEDDEFLPTRTLIERVLENADRSAWFKREWRNPMAAAKGLAMSLGDVYGIEATRAYVDGKQERGYYRQDLEDQETGESGKPSETEDYESWDWTELDELESA